MGITFTIYSFIFQLCEQNTFSSDAVVKAKGYPAIMRTPSMITFMLFMSDVVSLLRNFSLMLQENTATVASNKQKFDVTISVLKKYQVK